MRLDKYLKVSRIIKPGSEVHVGDILTIRFGEHIGRYEILSVADTVRKGDTSSLYRILQEDSYVSDSRNIE